MSDKQGDDKHGLGAKIRYRFDSALSKGPSVVIGWLGLVTLLIVLLAAIVDTAFRLSGISGTTHGLSFPEAFWQSVLRVFDSGTFAGDSGWPTRIVSLLTTLSGIFIAGSLIGLIANAVDQQIEELRKGRSDVLESDHTVILGWSDRVPPIIAELVLANESLKRAAVVIVADNDKTEMEEVIRQSIKDTKTTKTVCRSGEPWLIENLELANISKARSVIIIGTDDDSNTVKVVLAIHALQQSGAGFAGHIVAEVQYQETADSLGSLLGEGLVTIRSDDIVAELTAQACRQRGLSTIFRELLGFDGDELYFAKFPELVGRTYAETQMAFEKCSVVGVFDSTGKVTLNPSPDRPYGAGEELIGIAEDDSVYLTAATPVHGSLLAAEARTMSEHRRRIVIAGWSNLGPRVVAELDEFLDAQTTIELLLDPTKVDVEAIRASLVTTNVVVEISELEGGPESIARHAARIAFNEVIVLGYRDSLTVSQADARTLLTLVAFRQVRQTEDVGPVRMVAELLDQRNARLAQASGADDFIVSDELTSLMLAQLSERGELIQVFNDLFDKAGCSIELRPAPLYGAHLATTFADVVTTASSLGQSAIGYRRTGTGEVVTNPAKSAPLQLTRDDEIIVLAEATA
ncbi:MAG: TrkA-N domain protein [Ilumatobacteraceae bacterium]|nr:TrkA-N domain protein [Ilumatobacteraceae bacterium]